MVSRPTNGKQHRFIHRLQPFKRFLRSFAGWERVWSAGLGNKPCARRLRFWLFIATDLGSGHDLLRAMSTALPVAEESRSCIKQPALLFEAIQAAFSASLYVLIGGYYAVATATFAAILVATKFLMRRRVRSTNASLSAKQLSSRTPIA